MATLKNTTINDTGYLKLPTGTNAQRPVSPEIGMMRWNTTSSSTEVYDGTAWSSVGGSSLTANDILTCVSSVDGSGSGLDADRLDGLELHTDRNNEANKVVRTDGNGYIQAGWINTLSGATTSTLARVYASNDCYIRYYTPANFAAQISPYINVSALKYCGVCVNYLGLVTVNFPSNQIYIKPNIGGYMPHSAYNNNQQMLSLRGSCLDGCFYYSSCDICKVSHTACSITFCMFYVNSLRACSTYLIPVLYY